MMGLIMTISKMTLRIMGLISIVSLRIMGLIVTVSIVTLRTMVLIEIFSMKDSQNDRLICDTQHYDTQNNDLIEIFTIKVN
jgi:hypothetical protein